MKTLFLIFVYSLFIVIPLEAQQAEDVFPSSFFSGYEHSLHGGGFAYHSPNPEVTSSILIRSINSSDFIKWSTEKIPDNFKDSNAYFVWMFGIDVTEDSHLFSLYANGKKILEFKNPIVSKKESWTIKGIDGTELTFLPTMIDKYDDLMGYAVLKLPLNEIKKGESQVLKIQGQSAGSPSWYMTFESPVREEIKINQIPAVAKQNGKLYDLTEFMITHLGKKTKLNLLLKNGISKTVNIQPGYNSFLIRIPKVQKHESIEASLDMDGKTIERKIGIKPVRNWTVYLVEHTHTDVGYAEPQNEIMPEQVRYIDYALDFCDQTDDYPDNAKFRWTCETAWAVKEYLRTRPKEQIERLLKRIKEGRIEVTGLYLNMSDLYDESCLSDLLKTVRDFKNAGINVKTAMQDDVTGAAWCLVDYLKSAGIDYFSMGENPAHAQRPFDKPTAFWWESPSGNRILAYRGEHYQWGNGLGINSGDVSSFGNSLFRYLNNLKGRGYKLNKTMIQFSGYFIDDSPPSTKACDLVKEWNTKFEWPKLKLATVSEFFKSVDKNDSSELPTYRMAWPDWWTDGSASCALETSFIRNSQTKFIANQGMMSMAYLLGSVIKPDALQTLNSVNNNFAFFDEHTFGAAECITNPLSLNSTIQWNQKSAYAWTAVKQNGEIKQAALGLLRSHISKLKVPSITVFNTMNNKRSGIAEFFAYDNLVPANKNISVIDSAGNEIPVQIVKDGPGGYYWEFYAPDIPAFGYKTYKIIVGDKSPAKALEHRFVGTIENKYYKIEIDTSKGGIVSLIDKSRGMQLVDSKAPWELGQFIYERLENRQLLDGPHTIPYNKKLFTRTSMTDVKIGNVIDGPIWKSVTVTGHVNECADSQGVKYEIRLYKPKKMIQLVYSMKKLQVFKPEAAYVAFPFESPKSRIAFEVQGGTVIPGKSQLKGSASDWDGVQNFASIRGEKGQVVFVSPEIPLMEFGDINTGKFQKVSHVDKPYIYSYVLNNYWNTNFKSAQQGGLLWRYDVTSSSDTSLGYATRFGWNQRVPLIATFRPGGGTGDQLVSNSILHFNSNDLLLVFARPAWYGKGVVLCLRETEGKTAKLNVSELVSSKPSRSVYEVNSLEEPVRKVKGIISFRAHEVKFIMIKM